MVVKIRERTIPITEIEQSAFCQSDEELRSKPLVEEFQAGGRTVFFSSHNLYEVERLCHRVGIIREGELVAVEAVQALRDRRLRQMEVVLANDAAEDALRLPGVISMEREGRRLKFLVQGDINPVIRALAAVDVEDMSFEQPTLEDVFMDYYRGEDRTDR